MKKNGARHQTREVAASVGRVLRRAANRARLAAPLPLAASLLWLNPSASGAPAGERQPPTGNLAPAPSTNNPAALRPPILPSVTNGLIRFWPTVFDARDEVTGQDGLILGLVDASPAGLAEEDAFGEPHRGSVELRPAITNAPFTLAFWIWPGPQVSGEPVLLAQEAGGRGWWIRCLGLDNPNASRLVFDTDRRDQPQQESGCVIPAGAWHHAAIAASTNGVRYWLDGTAVAVSAVPRALPAGVGRLLVGNSPKADQPWVGKLQDLAVYDRELSPGEVQALFQRGRQQRPAHASPARLAAAIRFPEASGSSNLTVVPSHNFLHQQFTTDDGLPGNLVQATLQSGNGYLWVGTDVGLSRFDGRRFVNFTKRDTPAMAETGDDVICLAEDRLGRLWVGLYTGLLSLEEGVFRSHTAPLPERFVLCVEPARDGSLWLALLRSDPPDRGPCRLLRYDPARGRPEFETTVPGLARQLSVDAGGVWIATEDPAGLWRLSSEDAVPRLVTSFRGESFAPIAGGAALPPEARLRAWSSLERGLPGIVEFDPGEGRPGFAFQRPPPGHHVFANRWSGAAGAEAWVGSRLGMFRLLGGKAHQVVLDAASRGPDVSCICANRGGGVWFGTEEDGLHFVQERLVTMHHPGGTDAMVTSTAVSPEGGLWVASRDGVFRLTGDRWERREGGKGRAVTVTPAGLAVIARLYSGPGSVALHQVGGEGNGFALGQTFDSPTTLLTDHVGNVWVTCDQGLTRIDASWLARHARSATPGEDASAFRRWTRADGLPAAVPIGLLEARDGTVWVGSQGGGLARIVGDRVEKFDASRDFVSRHCAPRYQDPSGSIWIAGEAGLTRHRDGKFQVVTEQHGLPENTISDLLEDDQGWFWMAGRRGIHGVERRALDQVCDGLTNRVSCTTLSLGDGLATPECSNDAFPAMSRTPDGRVWVPTAKGLAAFDPPAVRRQHGPPPVVIEQLIVNRRAQWPAAGTGASASPPPGAPGSIALLPAGSGRHVQLHYTAVVPSHPKRVLFRHRLDGYDRDWSGETDLRLAVYTNLKPGRYTFRVQACNHQGTWNEAGAALAFVIAPHYWQTTWFLGGTVLAIGALLLWVHRARVRGLRRLQEFQHRQRFADERARIAADMHDDLGSALTQIAIMGEVARTQLADPDQAGTTLQQIAQAARDVTGRMSEIVWATNPHKDTLENLVAYLREYAARHFEPTPGRGALHFPEAVPDHHVSAMFRRNLLLVLKEALSNAAKHAAASRVEVRLSVAAQRLRLTVTDNGVGLSPAPRVGGLGLPGMRKRAADLGGGLRITSEPGGGTRVELDVPLEGPA